MKIFLTTALTSTFFLLATVKESAFALYTGNNTSPTTQGWTRGSGGTETVDSTGVTLDTRPNDSVRDGYSRVLNPAPNASSPGYNLQFKVRLVDENHDNPNAQNNTGVPNPNPADRAGLSVTMISSNRRGIELGFWLDRIWAQEGGAIKADPNTNASPPTSPTGTRFTQAEGVNFNTTEAVKQYDLSILNSVYYLYADSDYSAPILTGAVRDYTGEAAFAPLGLVYATPGFVFIGDNTSSARGSFRLEQMQLSNSAITPVPFAFNPLLGVGLFGLSRLRKANQRTNALKSAKKLVKN